MADESEERCYLVILSINPSTPDRLKEIVPALQSTLNRISVVSAESVFRSATADVFGYFIQTRMEAPKVKAAIESPGDRFGQGQQPFLGSGDGLFVMEVGRDFSAGLGFTRAATWLQHR